MKLTARPAYSYRDDPAVPAFPDDRPVLFVDGACTLCGWGARLIARRDRDTGFRFATAQSPLGRAVLRHYGLDPDDMGSWLLLEEGRATASLAAAIAVGRRLGAPWSLLARLAAPLPEALQDQIYELVARHRYRLFGRRPLCELPDPGLAARLID